MVGWQRVPPHSLSQLSEGFPLPPSPLESPHTFAFLKYSLRYPAQFNPPNATWMSVLSGTWELITHNEWGQ